MPAAVRGASARTSTVALALQLALVVGQNLAQPHSFFGGAAPHAASRLDSILITRASQAGLVTASQTVSAHNITIRGELRGSAIVAPLSAGNLVIRNATLICTSEACGSVPAIVLNHRLDAAQQAQGTVSDITAQYPLPVCNSTRIDDGCWTAEHTCNGAVMQCPNTHCPGGEMSVEMCFQCCNGHGFHTILLGGGCACHCADSVQSAQWHAQPPPSKIV